MVILRKTGAQACSCRAGGEVDMAGKAEEAEAGVPGDAREGWDTGPGERLSWTSTQDLGMLASL
jgi:hypothetical protein